MVELTYVLILSTSNLYIGTKGEISQNMITSYRCTYGEYWDVK